MKEVTSELKEVVASRDVLMGKSYAFPSTFLLPHHQLSISQTLSGR